MTEYYLPAGYGTAEYTEKKSRFIGQIWPVSTEEAARAQIETVKKHYHDARHNCWCFILRDGTIRYSDDGEPQGTAGQPMLEVFARQNICDVVCVVTRYFGGVLLGTGGLVRAYTTAAKETLTASGISVERLWDRILVPCPYSFYDRIRQETEKRGAIEETDYGADVLLTVLMPQDGTAGYLEWLCEISAGSIEGEVLEQVFRAFPVRQPGG